jgi:hypothetical protein
MSPLLTPMRHQVRSLALDMSESLLAVGYGNTVSLFDGKFDGAGPDWKERQVLKGPRNNPTSLVNALLFYPVGDGRHRLIIAYAEAGWR